MDARREDAARIRETVKAWDIILTGVITGAPAITVIALIGIIYIDQAISSQLASVLFFCICLFTVCLRLVLRRVCVVRKTSAAPPELGNLFDTDLVIENEMDVLPFYGLAGNRNTTFLYNLIYKNPSEFLKFRPAYGILLLCGYLCFVVGLFLYTLAGPVLDKDDGYSAAKVLLFTAGVLIASITYLANSGHYSVKPEPDCYSPFEHFVQIPMKVMVGKILSCFLASSAVHSMMALMILIVSFLCIIASNYLYRASEETIRSVLPDEIPRQRNFLCFVLIWSAISCMVVLFGMILNSWEEVRRNTVGTIEKNWERNMAAIEFLLQDVELESLEQIKQALYRKRERPNLTTDERAAFKYIDIPIWMTKRPFKGPWFSGGLAAEFADAYMSDDDDDDDHFGKRTTIVAEVHQDAPQEIGAPQDARSPILTRLRARMLGTETPQSRTPSAVAQPGSSRELGRITGPTPAKIRLRRTKEIHDRSDLRE